MAQSEEQNYISEHNDINEHSVPYAFNPHSIAAANDRTQPKESKFSSRGDVTYDNNIIKSQPHKPRIPSEQKRQSESSTNSKPNTSATSYRDSNNEGSGELKKSANGNQSYEWSYHGSHRSSHSGHAITHDCDLKYSLENIINIVRQETKFMKKKTKRKGKRNINGIFLLNDFLHLLQFHDDKKTFDYIKEELGDCKSNQCPVLKQRNNVLLYDIDRENKENSNHGSEFDKEHFEPIINKIHLYYCHSYDFGHRSQIEDTSKDRTASTDSNSLSETSSIDDIWKQRIINTHITDLKQILSNTTINKLHGIQNRHRRRYNAFTTFNKYNTYQFGVQFEYENDSKIDQGLGNEEEKEEASVSPIFYVKRKYSSLKDELLNNEVWQINGKQYELEYTKSEWHYDTKYRKVNFSEEFNMEHLLALLIYCNYTSLQYKFSETYRNSPDNHRNYYHLGKLIKEAVNIHGSMIRDDTIQKQFYRGVGETLLPAEIIGEKGIGVQIFCPLSTSSELCVAVTFTNFSDNGMIMEFGAYHEYNYTTAELGKTKYLSLEWLSDYPSEKEYLFIQNEHPLQIINIQDPTTGQEYQIILLALNIIDQIVSKDYVKWQEGMEFMKLLIAAIIDNKLSKTMNQYQPLQSLLSYPDHLVDTYFDNKKIIHLNYTKIKKECDFVANRLYRDNGKFIKMDVIKALFGNIEQIELLYIHSDVAEDIALDAELQNIDIIIGDLPISERVKLQKEEYKENTNGVQRSPKWNNRTHRVSLNMSRVKSMSSSNHLYSSIQQDITSDTAISSTHSAHFHGETEEKLNENIALNLVIDPNYLDSIPVSNHYVYSPVLQELQDKLQSIRERNRNIIYGLFQVITIFGEFSWSCYLLFTHQRNDCSLYTFVVISTLRYPIILLTYCVYNYFKYHDIEDWISPKKWLTILCVIISGFFGLIDVGFLSESNCDEDAKWLVYYCEIMFGFFFKEAIAIVLLVLVIGTYIPCSALIEGEISCC